MTAAATTITSTDATRPLSRPLSTVASFSSASQALSSGPASSTLSSLASVPVSWSPAPESVRTVVPRAQLEREGRCDPMTDSGNPDASGARLIIPAVSLRSALSKPTRTGRVTCLREVPSFAPPPGLDRCPESQSPESQPFEPTPISSPTAAPLSMTVPTRGVGLALEAGTPGSRSRRLLPAESTVPMRMPWRIGKATAAACGIGGLLLVLGLVASTTDAAESVAARIQLALQPDAIPAAAADPAPRFAALAPPAAPVEEVLAAATPTMPAEVIELETPAPKRVAAPRAVKRTVARPAVRAAAPPPIRLRSPY